MKILYAIQGTGNGHVARAREIIPLLQKLGEVDVLVGGDLSEVDLPLKPKFNFRGLTFVYNSHGGISYWKTIFKNNLLKLAWNIFNCPVHNYDLVINDFEFITAWACRLKKKPCLGMGHQASFRSFKVPRPTQTDKLGEFILKHYAPCSMALGFHFEPYDSFISTPVIRQEVRRLVPSKFNHITVYLPAFGLGEIVGFLKPFAQTSFHIFSRHDCPMEVPDHLKICKINNADFLKSLETATGLFTSAGFESPAEALFLGKKLAVIPIAHQYEQACNAAALSQLGVPVWKSLKEATVGFPKWLDDKETHHRYFPDNTLELLQTAISEFRKRF